MTQKGMTVIYGYFKLPDVIFRIRKIFITQKHSRNQIEVEPVNLFTRPLHSSCGAGLIDENFNPIRCNQVRKIQKSKQNRVTLIYRN
jgi:hypothetical protein